jgi:hypothetical protein
MEAEGLLGVAAGFEVELPLLSESVSDPIDTMHPSNPTAGI